MKKPRLSKEARQLLEEMCESYEAMAIDDPEDESERHTNDQTVALRLLLDWYDAEDRK